MEENRLLEIFGLTEEQLEILYSLERNLVILDIEKDSKNASIKRQWLDKYTNTLNVSMFPNKEMRIYDKDEIVYAIKDIAVKSQSKTWIYMVFLEAALFKGYFAIDEDKENTKRYEKLKYSADVDFLKKIAGSFIDPVCIDRYIEAAKKAYSKVTGKTKARLVKTAVVVTIAAIAAALCAVLAPGIAVAFFGSSFAGLHGAALVSACLAMAGGGAIAVGGLGMAGGVAAIAGGGALLGLVGGSAAVAGFSRFAKGSPDFTISQAVKLEVIMKEVLLNVQKDTVSAQLVIERLQDQLSKLQKEKMNLEAEVIKDKEEIKNLNKSIEVLTRAAKDMLVFKSAFETGLRYEA